MTSQHGGLYPASGDDRVALLRDFVIVARRRVQFTQIIGDAAGQRTSFEPCPQALYLEYIRSELFQAVDLDVPIHAVKIFVRQSPAMRHQSIPDNQRRLLDVCLERIEKFDKFFLLYAAPMQAEMDVGTRESGDHRAVISIDLRLNDVLRFLLRAASLLRSMALFSGFYELKSNEPSIRKSCARQKRTPFRRSMTIPAHLTVLNPVPIPYSFKLRRRIARNAANSSSTSWAGRSRSGPGHRAQGTGHRCLLHNEPSHLYKVLRVIPTPMAVSTQTLPANSNPSAFNCISCFNQPIFCHDQTL